MRLLRAAVLGAAMLMPAMIHAEEATPHPGGDPVTGEQLHGRLEGLLEQVTTLQTDVDKLKKFKFSGYLQGRIEFGEASRDEVSVSSSNALSAPNVSRFHIRRGRLKLTYDSSPLSQAVVYFDGGADRTVRLLEAYVTLLDPWTPTHDHRLTLGQFNVPFGHEIERSSSVRELPERSRAENVLFSGERDRGIKLDSQWNPSLSTSLALLNGGGINSTDFPTTDPTRAKDVVARARWTQGTFDIAASWYAGRHVTPLTASDLSTDKTRLGLDAQFYFATPGLGGSSLRAEVYTGHDVNADSLKAIVTTGSAPRVLNAGRDPDHVATDVQGGYLMLVQNLGDRFQLALRHDRWDPNVDADHDQYRRTSLGVNAFYDAFTRLSVSYDDIRTEVAAAGGAYNDPKDNLWTVQLQHKF